MIPWIYCWPVRLRGSKRLENVFFKETIRPQDYIGEDLLLLLLFLLIQRKRKRRRRRRKKILKMKRKSVQFSQIYQWGRWTRSKLGQFPYMASSSAADRHSRILLLPLPLSTTSCECVAEWIWFHAKIRFILSLSLPHPQPQSSSSYFTIPHSRASKSSFPLPPPTAHPLCFIWCQCQRGSGKSERIKSMTTSQEQVRINLKVVNSIWQTTTRLLHASHPPDKPTTGTWRCFSGGNL